MRFDRIEAGRIRQAFHRRSYLNEKLETVQFWTVHGGSKVTTLATVLNGIVLCHTALLLPICSLPFRIPVDSNCHLANHLFVRFIELLRFECCQQTLAQNNQFFARQRHRQFLLLKFHSRSLSERYRRPVTTYQMGLGSLSEQPVSSCGIAGTAPFIRNVER
jgi:hypothetical protein